MGHVGQWYDLGVSAAEPANQGEDDDQMPKLRGGSGSDFFGPSWVGLEPVSCRGCRTTTPVGQGVHMR